MSAPDSPYRILIQGIPLFEYSRQVLLRDSSIGFGRMTPPCDQVHTRAKRDVLKGPTIMNYCWEPVRIGPLGRGLLSVDNMVALEL